ncbi:MAG: LysR family transcriptional regulator [Proteobacteria bacterium]|nr:LysR family transcriptional regulator [Pseudomonadota bacterium]
MDTLTAMKVYCSVVENDSLAGAARTLNISPSVVSKQLSALEDRLGVRLLNRTTRRVSVTEVGTAYYDRCKRIIADVDEAEVAVSRSHSQPRGMLRITAPSTFAHRHVTPHLPKFIDRYPEVELQVQVNDRIVDLVDDGIDLAIRIAQLKDSSLIARRLASNHRSIVATPEYLKTWGIPERPEDFLQHALITWLPGNLINDWHFVIDGKEQVIRTKGTISMNNGDSILSTVLAGGGLAMMNAFMTGEYVQDGRLLAVMEDYVREDVPIYAVYPSSRHLSPKVRAFVDFLLETYGPKPYWLGK